jgi:hypothetical protein
MSAVDTSAARSVPAPRDPVAAPHVHAWELRAVEFDTWGQVSFYECLGCASVRYA